MTRYCLDLISETDLATAPLYQCVQGVVFEDWERIWHLIGPDRTGYYEEVELAPAEIRRKHSGTLWGKVWVNDRGQPDLIYTLWRVALGELAIKVRGSDVMNARDANIDLNSELFVCFPATPRLVECTIPVLGMKPSNEDYPFLVGEHTTLLEDAPYYTPIKAEVSIEQEPQGLFYTGEMPPSRAVQEEILAECARAGVAISPSWEAPIRIDWSGTWVASQAAAYAGLTTRSTLIRVPSTKWRNDPSVCEFYFADGAYRYPAYDCWPNRQEGATPAAAAAQQQQEVFVSPYPAHPPPIYAARPRLPRTTTDWPTIRAYRKRGLREGYDYNNNPPRMWVIVRTPAWQREFAYEDWSERQFERAPSLREAAEDVLRAVMPQPGVRVLVSDPQRGVVRLTEADWERDPRMHLRQGQ